MEKLSTRRLPGRSGITPRGLASTPPLPSAVARTRKGERNERSAVSVEPGHDLARDHRGHRAEMRAKRLKIGDAIHFYRCLRSLNPHAHIPEMGGDAGARGRAGGAGRADGGGRRQEARRQSPCTTPRRAATEGSDQPDRRRLPHHASGGRRVSSRGVWLSQWLEKISRARATARLEMRPFRITSKFSKEPAP